MNIVWLIVIGLIVGALARFAVPGKDPMGMVATAGLGIVGSFVGGFIGSLFDSDRSITDFTTAGLFMSIIGAIIALLVWRSWKSR